MFCVVGQDDDDTAIELAHKTALGGEIRGGRRNSENVGGKFFQESQVVGRRREFFREGENLIGNPQLLKVFDANR